MKFHQHKWHVIIIHDTFEIECIKCGRLTQNPWFPLWKRSHRVNPYLERKYNFLKASQRAIHMPGAEGKFYISENDGSAISKARAKLSQSDIK